MQVDLHVGVEPDLPESFKGKYRELTVFPLHAGMDHHDVVVASHHATFGPSLRKQSRHFSGECPRFFVDCGFRQAGETRSVGHVATPHFEVVGSGLDRIKHFEESFLSCDMRLMPAKIEFPLSLTRSTRLPSLL